MNLRLNQQKNSRSQECSMPMVQYFFFICLYIHVARGLSPGTPTFSDKSKYKLYTQLAEFALTYHVRNCIYIVYAVYSRASLAISFRYYKSKHHKEDRTLLAALEKNLISILNNVTLKPITNILRLNSFNHLIVEFIICR
jgi:hypothetical protein